MRQMKRFLLLIVALLVLLPLHLQADEFFEKQVRPLLVAKCYQCHAGKKQSGGLSLETKAGWAKGGESGPAIIPGDVAGSLLIDAINYRGMEMPPADEGGKGGRGPAAVDRITAVSDPLRTSCYAGEWKALFSAICRAR